jgi:hypothetical protein
VNGLDKEMPGIEDYVQTCTKLHKVLTNENNQSDVTRMFRLRFALHLDVQAQRLENAARQLRKFADGCRAYLLDGDDK